MYIDTFCVSTFATLSRVAMSYLFCIHSPSSRQVEIASEMLFDDRADDVFESWDPNFGFPSLQPYLVAGPLGNVPVSRFGHLVCSLK